MNIIHVYVTLFTMNHTVIGFEGAWGDPMTGHDLDLVRDHR